jgi:hypothetical protein
MKSIKTDIKEIFIARVPFCSELMSEIKSFAKKQNITLGEISGIGAVSSITLAYYNQEKRVYIDKSFEGDFEIVNLTGNISIKDDEPFAHIHITLSNSEFGVIAGHLIEAKVFACELNIKSFEGKISRAFDDETGLFLWNLSKN